MQTVTVNDKRITYVQNASCHFYWNMNLTVAARTGKEQTCNMIGLGFSNVLNMYKHALSISTVNENLHLDPSLSR